MSLRYATMRPGDIEQVMQVERSVYSHPWTPGNFRDSLAAGHNAWVVRCEGVLLAYCVLMIAPDEAHLLNISVAQEAQGRGIGRGMLEWVGAQAGARGCSSVLLEVRVSNMRAIRMYSLAGYERLGMRRNYYPAAQGREDAIVMRKALVSS